MKTQFSKVGLTCLMIGLLSLTHCVDHVLDPLVIKTLPFTTGLTFKVEATSLGDKPVTEYGIVNTSYLRASPTPHNMDPTVADRKIVFPTSIGLGINQHVIPSSTFFSGQTFFYYRAYAILDDGSVIYGNRLAYTFPDPF